MDKDQINAVQSLVLNQLFSFLNLLNEEQREVFFDKIFKIYCRYCYRLLNDTECYCTNDE